MYTDFSIHTHKDCKVDVKVNNLSVACPGMHVLYLNIGEVSLKVFGSIEKLIEIRNAIAAGVIPNGVP